MSRLQKPRISIAPALNAPPAFWRDVWARLEAEGTARFIFCDGSVRDADSFVSEMNATHVHPFCMFADDKLAAIVWLTNLEGKSCRGHFAVFAQYGIYSRHLGSTMREYLLQMRHETGEYCFDVLVGMVPKLNCKAFNVVKRAGFVHTGTIPRGAWIEEQRMSVDMLILTATREE